MNFRASFRRWMRDLLGQMDALAQQASGLPGWAGLATDAAQIDETATLANAGKCKVPELRGEFA